MSERNDPKEALEGSSAGHAKKSYSVPTLRRLGSVRELTLGASGAFGDGTDGKFQKTP